MHAPLGSTSGVTLDHAARSRRSAARGSSRVTKALVLCAVVGSAGLLEPETARAGEAEARSLFAEGRQLRLAGQCAEAIPRFRQALETYPDALGSLRNLAECEEELGRYASARRSYWDLRVAALKTSDPKYEGWDRDATEAHARLASRVARLQIRVTGPSAARVYLNGTPFDPRLYGVEVEHDLGRLQAELRDGSASPKKTVLELREGQSYEIELVSELPPDAPDERDPGAAGAASAGGREPGELVTGRDAGWMRTAGFVSLGVAGLSAIGLGVSVAVRADALSTVETSCRATGDGYACPSALEGDVDTGRTSSTLATAFGVGLGVGAGVGAGLLLASLLTDDTPSDTVALELMPSTEGAYLGLRGRF